jgi:class 3 adenylate cyclase
VTALFADIKGSTELMREIDPEEARAIVDPALKLMIDAAHATTVTSCNPLAMASLPCSARRSRTRTILNARCTRRLALALDRYRRNWLVRRSVNLGSR